MQWRTYERIESVWMWMTRRRLFEWIIGLLILDVLLLIGGYSPLHWLRMRLVQDTGVVLWARLPRIILQNLGVRPGQRRRVLLRQRALHVFTGDT